LLSSRHTSSIFKISGSDGSIIWTLSGKSHDFDHSDGFNFSWQHDARYIYENQTTSVISFFDNAGVGINEESKTTGNWSRAVVVEINTSVKPMTTRVLHSYDRPDREISIARGNMQTLPNSNVFVGWATHGLISELTQDGTSVMEAKFSDGKMSTYRSYKFNFTGRPHLPPVTKSFVHGSSPNTANTFHYISWNGATEVHFWNLYGAAKNSSESFSLLAKVEKTDFETMYMTKGYIGFVYAEALDADGKVMGLSIAAASEVPKTWIGAFCTTNGNCAINKEDASEKIHEGVESDSADSKDHEIQHTNTQTNYQPKSKSLTRVVEDMPLILGIGFMAISVFAYVFIRLFKRRNRARYQHVE
jgi:hypothetical protein